ncbi:MAG: hypothetical protein HGA44_01295 [Cellulomonadaceae bacterium]|nr:hypothetical protein [Cellulomonadaceae bacterium]
MTSSPSEFDSALALFLDEVNRASDLVALADGFEASLPAVDLSDLYRAALVAGVSAFDAFVHRLVLAGLRMRLSSKGLGSPPGAIELPVATVAGLIADEPGALASATALIQERLRRKTFQRPDDVAKAVSAICVGPLWISIADGDSQEANRLKVSLDLVVDRRNKIVHEADIDPTFGEKWPMDSVLVRDALSVISLRGREVSKFVALHYDA